MFLSLNCFFLKQSLQFFLLWILYFFRFSLYSLGGNLNSLEFRRTQCRNIVSYCANSNIRHKSMGLWSLARALLHAQDWNTLKHSTVLGSLTLNAPSSRLAQIIKKNPKNSCCTQGSLINANTQSTKFISNQIKILLFLIVNAQTTCTKF